jgi:hypothetical protein
MSEKPNHDGELGFYEALAILMAAALVFGLLSLAVLRLIEPT